MRSFVIRSRKGSVLGDKIREQIGTEAHVEIISHTLMNAFYYSNGIRSDVEVFVVLDSSPDFPRTVRFYSCPELSFPGFDDRAILAALSNALLNAKSLKKDETIQAGPGIEISGFGFDKLMQQLLETRTVYALEQKAPDIRSVEIAADPVFVLSDHIPMPPKSLKSLERKGLQQISLGRRMLFASQCVVVVNSELDRR